MVAASREVKYLKDFTGGLFLSSDPYGIRETENQLPQNCLNVDFRDGGGFVLRGGFEYLADDPNLDGAQWLVPYLFRR